MNFITKLFHKKHKHNCREYLIEIFTVYFSNEDEFWNTNILYECSICKKRWVNHHGNFIPNIKIRNLIDNWLDQTINTEQCLKQLSELNLKFTLNKKD